VIIHLKNVVYCKSLIRYLFTCLIAVSGYAGELGEAAAPQQDFAPNLPQDRYTAGMVFIPGDGVAISTYPDSASLLSGVFSIDDQGYVELPVAGKVKISHMSKMEFEDYLKQEFKDYLRFPIVQVKPLIRLSVLGGVPRPGLYYFDQDRSLWEVLYEVGGTQDEDGLKKMRWERDGKTVENNLIPYLERGVSLRRMRFQSGDQIWVKTPTKPGTGDKVRRAITTLGALGGIITAYITVSKVIVDGL
jgi:protein involved in polysaccharide export with SLBB domain